MKSNHIRIQWAVIAVSLFALLFTGAVAHAALQAAGPVNPVGFPAYYTDTTGFSLAPCLDQNGFCLLTPPFDTPASPITTAKPITALNFPLEVFYWFADSTMDVGPTLSEKAVLRLALEGTFANGTVTDGQQMAFLRINLAAMKGLTPGTYTVTHPFGTFTFAVDAAGDAKGGVGNQAFRTEDGGFGPLDFTSLLPATTTGIGPFLTCATGPLTSPDGNLYIGSPVAPCAVTGGTNNFFRITGPDIGGQGVNTIQTTQFTLAGKMVGMTVAPTTFTFSPTNQAGLLRTSSPFTVTNISTITELTLGAITLSGPNAAEFAVGAANTCTAPIPASGTCSFTVDFTGLAPSGVKTATVTIPVSAPANIPSGVVTVSGTIDAVPPTVLSTNPANGSIVPSNTTLTAIFSEPMAAATINDTTFTVAGITGTVNYDAANNTATFIPTALVTNVTYTATITTGATDEAGNGLAENKVFSFTTIPPDFDRPTVVSTSPVGSGAPVDSAIKVVFSEQMHAGSITAATFTVSNGVIGAITYDTATNTATLTPSAPLEPGTPYTVTIKGGAGGVDDLAQNTLLNDYQWIFLTNNPPSAPEVVSRADGATGQPATVVLTWLKATDDDGDTLTYQVYVCNNQFFVGCNANTVSASAPRLNGAYFAGISGLGIAVIGLVSFGGIHGRRRFLSLMIVVLLLSGVVFVACGGGGGGGGTPAPSNELSYTANLNSGALYYWKVEANDGKAGIVASAVRSFRTQ